MWRIEMKESFLNPFMENWKPEVSQLDFSAQIFWYLYTILVSFPFVFQLSQFSSLVMSNTLWPHGMESSRPPCLSPTPRVCSNSCQSRWWSNHLILCCPLLLLPSIFPSISVFSNESTLHIRWPKYWSFSFSISPSNEYSGLISFRMDWLDLLAVQGTLKSLLQHHSSKTSAVLSFLYRYNSRIHTRLLEKP